MNPNTSGYTGFYIHRDANSITPKLKRKLEIRGCNSIFFHHSYNSPACNIPSTVRMIEFGDDFDQSVDELPEGIIFLKMGYKFNHSLNRLPISLRTLILSSEFQILQELKGGEYK